MQCCAHFETFYKDICSVKYNPECDFRLRMHTKFEELKAVKILNK